MKQIKTVTILIATIAVEIAQAGTVNISNINLDDSSDCKMHFIGTSLPTITDFPSVGQSKIIDIPNGQYSLVFLNCGWTALQMDRNKEKLDYCNIDRAIKKFQIGETEFEAEGKPVILNISPESKPLEIALSKTDNKYECQIINMNDF